jgi:1-deoxy-D-xylulose-5-phosphate synthase
LELARKNPKIVGVTPAMPTGCSMTIMMREMPDRTFDVGIAEGHAVTFSAGMAKDGLMPFCNIYSAFAQRAYDNIIHDVAILKLPVVLCLDRAGLVGEDGPTHHGAFDLAFLRVIPNLTICSPMNEHELRRLMYTAQLPDMGPFVIRYPRGQGVKADWRCPLEPIKVGTGRKLRDGDGSVAVLSIGPYGNDVAKAVEGTKAAHYDMRFLKPIDETLLHEIGSTYRKIITVENGVRNGGLGSAVLEWMNDHGYHQPVVRMGLPDEFVEHGSVAELQKIVGMDAESIRNEINAPLGEVEENCRV